MFELKTWLLLPALCVLILSTTRYNNSETIDFEKMIAEAELPGVLDPNSITIFNKATGQSVPFALSEDYAYNDRARLIDLRRMERLPFLSSRGIVDE